MKKKNVIIAVIIVTVGAVFSGCYIRTYPQRPEPRYYEHGYYRHNDYHHHRGYHY